MVAGLLVVYGYFVFFHGAVPNIRTAPAIRKKVIELLRQDFLQKSGGLNGRPYTIIDLGSGNGLLTREIAKALPEARVIGVEIAHQSVIWANVWKRHGKLGNLEYRRMNFFDVDFAEADAFFMYLIPQVLGTLGKKVHAGAKTGALILSNKFRIGGDWEAPHVVRVPTFYFHQGELNIYRK